MLIPKNFIYKVMQTTSISASYTGDIVLNNVTNMATATAGDPHTYIIMDDLESPTKVEIVHGSTVAGGSNSLNISARAQEGTTGQTWTSGAYVVQDITNAILDNMAQFDGDNTFTELSVFTNTHTGFPSDKFLVWDDGSQDIISIGMNTGAGEQEFRNSSGDLMELTSQRIEFTDRSSNQTVRLQGGILSSTNAIFELGNQTTLAGLQTLYGPGGDTDSAYIKWDMSGLTDKMLFQNTSSNIEIGTALGTGSEVMLADGSITPTADMPMGSNKITGLANGTAATDAATYGQLTSGAGNYSFSTISVPGTTTGSIGYTGAGFTPKMVKVRAFYSTAADNVSFGTTDGTTTRSLSNDYSASHLWEETANLVHFWNDTGSTVDKASFVSLDADGFTVNWSTRSADQIVLHVEYYA